MRKVFMGKFSDEPGNRKLDMPPDKSVELFEEKPQDFLVVSLDQLRLIQFCSMATESLKFDHACISKSKILVANKKVAVWSELQRRRTGPSGFKSLSHNDRILLDKSYVEKAICALESQGCTECFIGNDVRAYGPQVIFVDTRPKKDEEGHELWQRVYHVPCSNVGGFPDEHVMKYLGMDWRTLEHLPFKSDSRLLQFCFNVEELSKIIKFVNMFGKGKRLILCLLAEEEDGEGVVSDRRADGIPMKSGKFWFKFRLAQSGRICCGVSTTCQASSEDPSLDDVGALNIPIEGDDSNDFIDAEEANAKEDIEGSPRLPVPEPPF